jgi:hypothetical protein
VVVARRGRRAAHVPVSQPHPRKIAAHEAGVLRDFSRVMVHDCLTMYFNYDKATNAICGAYLLRDLASVGVR